MRLFRSLSLRIVLAIIVLLSSVGGALPSLSATVKDKQAVKKDINWYDDSEGCAATTDISGSFGGDPICKGVKLPTITDAAGFAKAIDDYIKKHFPTSPLNGLGADFVKAGVDNGVNPAWMVSIAEHESSMGTNGRTTAPMHNPFGYMYFGPPDDPISRDAAAAQGLCAWNDSGHQFCLRQLDSWSDGIAKTGRYLQRRYLAKGIDSIEKVTPIYCGHPPNCNPKAYIEGVHKIIDPIIDAAGSAVACGVAGAAPASTAPAPASTPTPSSTAPPASTSTTPTGLTGPVYLLGDSILARAQSGGLTKKLTDVGWQPTFDAVSGRVLSGNNLAGGTNGMDALEADRAAITAANTAVIELGVNGGDSTDFGTQINNFIAKLRSINDSITVYWVNIGASGKTDIGVDQFNTRNVAINNQAGPDNYEVIDWERIVFDGQNPATIKDKEASTSNPPALDSDLINLNQGGIGLFSDRIVNFITAGGDQAQVPPSDACSAFGSPLSVATTNGFNINGAGAMAYYSQEDPAYRSQAYGHGTIGKCGCGPTSVAMVVATLKDPSIKPTDTANFSSSGGYQLPSPDCGSAWSLFPAAARQYGLNERSLGVDIQAAVAIIKAGGLVIVSFGPGDFTRGGHFVVMRGITSDGKLLFADPNDGLPGQANYLRKSTTAWDPATIKGQARAMFGFTK